MIYFQQLVFLFIFRHDEMVNKSLRNSFKYQNNDPFII